MQIPSANKLERSVVRGGGGGEFVPYIRRRPGSERGERERERESGSGKRGGCCGAMGREWGIWGQMGV